MKKKSNKKALKTYQKEVNKVKNERGIKYQDAVQIVKTYWNKDNNPKKDTLAEIVKGGNFVEDVITFGITNSKRKASDKPTSEEHTQYVKPNHVKVWAVGKEKADTIFKGMDFTIEVAESPNTDELVYYYVFKNKEDRQKAFIAYHYGGVQEDVKDTFSQGGGIKEGYHEMPSGDIMKDSDHLAKGGEVLYDPIEDDEENKRWIIDLEFKDSSKDYSKSIYRNPSIKREKDDPSYKKVWELVEWAENQDDLIYGQVNFKSKQTYGTQTSTYWHNGGKSEYAKGGVISDEQYRTIYYGNLYPEYDTMEQVKRDVHKLMKDESMTFQELLDELYYSNSYAKGGEISYEGYISKKKELNNKMDSLNLDSYNWRDEKVRMGAEYRSVKSKFDRYFKEYQDLNKSIPKEFAKRQSREHRAASIKRNQESNLARGGSLNGIPYTYVVYDIEDKADSLFEIGNERDLKIYLEEWNDIMEESYRNHLDFNKGEEYYTIDLIFAKGGELNKTVTNLPNKEITLPLQQTKRYTNSRKFTR